VGPERFGPPAVKDVGLANNESATPLFFLKQLQRRFDCPPNRAFF